jgi:hypothetical protein
MLSVVMANVYMLNVVAPKFTGVHPHKLGLFKANTPSDCSLAYLESLGLLIVIVAMYSYYELSMAFLHYCKGTICYHFQFYTINTKTQSRLLYKSWTNFS